MQHSPSEWQQKTFCMRYMYARELGYLIFLFLELLTTATYMIRSQNKVSANTLLHIL